MRLKPIHVTSAASLVALGLKFCRACGSTEVSAVHDLMHIFTTTSYISITLGFFSKSHVLIGKSSKNLLHSPERAMNRRGAPSSDSLTDTQLHKALSVAQLQGRLQPSLLVSEAEKGCTKDGKYLGV